jgi:PAS domain S-box-containing protein
MTDEKWSIVLVGGSDRLDAALADAGFDVTAVDSASRCLDAVERGHVDGVVGAYDLPDLDGVRLRRSIRIFRPSLPFVLLAPADAADAVAADVRGDVPGDDPDRVVARLREALDQERPWVDEESHTRYRHLVETSPVAINLFDASGESIWCNEAALDLLGLERRDELVGHSIFEFVHPDDADVAERERSAVVERGESVGPTYMRLRRPDGGIRHVQVATAVGRFLGENIGQAVVVDVTALQETRRALRAERRFVDRALDTLEDVFYVVDDDGNLLQWNEAATTVTGHDDAALASMTVGDLFTDADADRIEASIERVFESGSDTVEATLVTRQGRHVPYEFRGRRLSEGSDDAPPRVVGIGRDVSERKERKRQLQVLEQWLRHNIRNDMNVIRGTAENVRHGRVDDTDAALRRIEAYSEHVVAQADRERRIVEVLTDPLDAESVDVSTLVDREVRRARLRHPEADIDVVGETKLVAVALPDLAAAVRELLENAIEYSDDAPTVQVEIDRHDDGRAVVRIADEGPGIPDIERRSLLLEADIDQLHHSSGLGLLFAAWVVRLSGGTLHIEANEPRGSVVTLTLPAAESP